MATSGSGTRAPSKVVQLKTEKGLPLWYPARKGPPGKVVFQVQPFTHSVTVVAMVQCSLFPKLTTELGVIQVVLVCQACNVLAQSF